ncbi:hypothetical protein ACFLTB_04175 [Chloroflexota bacterium]
MGDKKKKTGEFKFSLNRKGEPVVTASSRKGQARAIESICSNPVTVIIKR